MLEEAVAYKNVIFLVMTLFESLAPRFQNQPMGGRALTTNDLHQGVLIPFFFVSEGSLDP